MLESVPNDAANRFSVKSLSLSPLMMAMDSSSFSVRQLFQ